MKKDIVIVDYGMGNIFSIKSAFEFCGAVVKISSDPDVISQANKLILPGVGSFPDAMEEIKKTGIQDALNFFVSKDKPILGICLGMQIFLNESSEFGMTKGLGFIPGRIIAIPSKDKIGNPLKLPHVGWSHLLFNSKTSSGASENSILDSINPEDNFYFVHSYMAKLENPLENCVAIVEYGGHQFPAVIKKNNITGCQFHPEKSGNLGLKIISNFLKTNE